jgi:hypothetical protein
VKLTTKKIHHSKTKCLPCTNICCNGGSQRIRLFEDTFSEMSADTPNRSKVGSSWGLLSDTIYTSALAAFGKKEHRNADWYEVHWTEMQPLTEAKRETLLAHMQNPCSSTHDVLRAARNKAQQTDRRCANDYWLNLHVYSKIQSAAITGNAKGMYDSIKTGTGPTATKTTLLMSARQERL